MTAQRIRTIALAIALFFCMACATKSEIANIEAFAQAGGQYTDAVNGLLEKAGQTLVDASSNKALKNRDDLIGAGVTFDQSLQNNLKDNLDANNQTMHDQLNEFFLISRQVELLGQYFQGLGALAQSRAPDRVSRQLGDSVDGLNALSSAIKDKPLFRNPGAVSGIFQDVGNLVVSGIQSGILKKRLEKDKDHIDAVIIILHELLSAIKKALENEREFANARQLETLVVEPFITEGALSSPPERQQWKDNRFLLLSKPPLDRELKNAIDASLALRQAWVSVLSNKLGPADLLDFSARTQSLMANIEALRSPQPPPPDRAPPD